MEEAYNDIYVSKILVLHATHKHSGNSHATLMQSNLPYT